MTTGKWHLTGLAIVASMAAPLSAQTVNYDFNAGATDFMSQFTERGSGNATYFSTGGVSNSGAIRGPGATSAAAIYATPFANAAGTTFTISIDFLGGLQPTAEQGDVVGVGLLSTSDFGWQGGKANHYFYENYVELNNASSQNLTSLLYFKGDPSGGGSGGMKIFTPMLTTDNWYRLTAIYTNTGSDFDVSLSLYNIGSGGTSMPALVNSATGVAGLSELASAPQIYAGIYGGTVGGETQMARRLDNFSVDVVAVPEPATPALLALGGVALVIASRTRRAREMAVH